MKKIFKNIKGETILETLIALSILAVGITLASTVVGYSLRNINASKNRVIAVNIARGSIEAMRNIRDTNWLKYSGNRRRCWNNDPGESNCERDPNNSSMTLTPIEPGRYIIYKEEGMGNWKLADIKGGIGTTNLPEPPDATTNPSEGDSYYDTAAPGDGTTYVYTDENWVDIRNLFFVDIDDLTDTDGNADFNDDSDMYNHAVIVPIPTNDALGHNRAKRTVFKRFLTIEYLANDGTIIQSPASVRPEHNRMRITATVIWQEGKNQFSTALSTHLTDYLGRDSLDG